MQIIHVVNIRFIGLCIKLFFPIIIFEVFDSSVREREQGKCFLLSFPPLSLSLLCNVIKWILPHYLAVQEGSF